jgi:hypothetical protein
MSQQYLQSTHIPRILVQSQGASQTEVLPDWLNVSYLDLQEKAVDYQFHIVSETDIAQPDAIAYNYYGDSNWWWLLCSFNGIVNPMTDMVLGQRLKIPNLHIVQLLLAPKQKQVNLINNYVTI